MNPWTKSYAFAKIKVSNWSTLKSLPKSRIICHKNLPKTIVKLMIMLFILMSLLVLADLPGGYFIGKDRFSHSKLVIYTCYFSAIRQEESYQGGKSLRIGLYHSRSSRSILKKLTVSLIYWWRGARIQHGPAQQQVLSPTRWPSLALRLQPLKTALTHLTIPLHTHSHKQSAKLNLPHHLLIASLHLLPKLHETNSNYHFYHRRSKRLLWIAFPEVFCSMKPEKIVRLLWDWGRGVLLRLMGWSRIRGRSIRVLLMGRCRRWILSRPRIGLLLIINRRWSFIHFNNEYHYSFRFIANSEWLIY